MDDLDFALLDDESPPAKAEPLFDPDFDVLGCVEYFLLPTSNYHSQQNQQKLAHKSTSFLQSLDANLTPRVRLNQTCLQVCLADHIKTIQTMYRDFEDDQQVCADLRRDHGGGGPMPLRYLQEKIMEGHARIVALCRLCYGDHSLEMLRASVDLASSYAQQGMWAQAKEAISACFERLNWLLAAPNRVDLNFALKKSREAAAVVHATFSCLRTHCAANGGQVTKTFVKELVAELSRIPSPVERFTLSDLASADQSYLSSTTKLAGAVHAFLTDFDGNPFKRGTGTGNGTGTGTGTGTGNEHDTASLKKKDRMSPSWGDLVDHLRHSCQIMKALISDMEDAILPQHRASISLSFEQCDQLHKGVAHAGQLSQCLSSVHNSARLMAGTTLIKNLQQMKTEVSLKINVRTRLVQDVSVTTAPRSLFNKGTVPPPEAATVVYELPVTWEEVLSSLVLQRDVDPLLSEQAHLLTLRGITEVFTDNLSDAEGSMREALRILEQQGLEMEVVACELYNTIAQMMIVKYRQAEGKRKLKIKKAAAAWLLTEQGRKELREQMKNIRAEFMSKLVVISASESEIRARNLVLKNKIKEIRKYAEKDTGDAATKNVEAAYRYVVRSFEILESTHGSSHPAVATACLAVASVQNLSEKHGEAREWLSRALRLMEKISPQPVRAIAFAQTQLCQVLAKEGYVDEAMHVLGNAASFYTNQAYDRLHKINFTASSGFTPSFQPNAAAAVAPLDAVHMQNQHFVCKPFQRGRQPYEDVAQAMELGQRLQHMNMERGNLEVAMQQSEALADLAELAYGWDSVETCDYRKEAGEQAMALENWTRAVDNFKKCLEAADCLYGKSEPKCIEIAKHLQTASEKRNQAFANEMKQMSPSAHAAAKIRAANQSLDPSNGYPAAGEAEGGGGGGGGGGWDDPANRGRQLSRQQDRVQILGIH